jgi:hypothetical protein
MRLMLRIVLPVVVAITIAVAGASYIASATPCEFVLGFKTLHDMIPQIVGDCRSDELHNPDNGDGLQLTTNGLLVWRKADNFTAFTDSLTTWVNGPYGLQSRPNGDRFEWEVTTSPPPVPPPAESLPPGSDTLVQQAIADAARRAGVDPTAVGVVSVEDREWSDSSLGCPKPGQFYAQVITPGFLIVVEAAGQRYEYHTDAGRRLELC